MDIYSSGQSTIMTPAHNYAGTTDFTTILKDMEKGLFPTGTGQPFPVNFDENPNTPAVDAMSPWVAHCTPGLTNPPHSQVIGPKAFGL